MALPVWSQSSSETPNEPFLRGSNRAIVFSLDELRLGEVNGGLGGRLFISPSAALRGTFSMGVESKEDVNEGVSDYGRSAFNLGTTFLVEWHSRAFRHVSPYMGSGFGAGFRIFSETTDYETGQLLQLKNQGRGVDFSVVAAFGVEVHVTKSVSLMGEHRFGTVIFTGTEEHKEFFRDNPSLIQERDIREFDFEIGTSQLMVSIYF